MTKLIKRFQNNVKLRKRKKLFLEGEKIGDNGRNSPICLHGFRGNSCHRRVSSGLHGLRALIVTGVGVDVWSPLSAIEALELLYYWATAILNYIVAFTAPAAVIIAVRSIWALAKEK
jgi:hypothetical protein